MDLVKPKPAAAQDNPLHFARKWLYRPLPHPPSEWGVRQNLEGVITIIEVSVRDNNVEQALRVLKKKLQREGIYREMKLRKHYEKPSLRKTREKEESIRRARKMQRKKRERDGY